MPYHRQAGQDEPKVWAHSPRDPLTNFVDIKKALHEQMQANQMTPGRPASASVHQRLQPLVVPASRGRPYSAMPSAQKSKPNLWAVPQTPIICSPTGFGSLPGDHSFNRVWQDAPLHSHRFSAHHGGHSTGAAMSPASRDDTTTTLDCASAQAGRLTDQHTLPTSYWTILQPPMIPAARRFGWDVTPPPQHAAPAEQEHDSPQQAELEWQALKRVARWHRRKVMLRVIRAWIAGMQFHRATAHKARKAVRLYMYTCKHRVWQQWLQYAHSKMVRRRRGAVALHRMQHSKTVKVLCAWLDLVHQSRIDSVKECRAAHHADKVCTSKMFHAWHAATHEGKASHRKEARAAAHARLRVLTLFLDSWRTFAASRRRHHVILKRTAAKQYKATLSKFLWAWQAAASHIKLERVQGEAQELLAMNKELLSAVKAAEATAADSARRAQLTADEAAAAQEAAAAAEAELQRLRSEHKDLKDSTSALASAAQAAADAASAATAQANRHLAAAEAERAHLTMLLTSQRQAARQAAEHETHSAPAGQPRQASWLGSVPPVATSTPSKTLDKHGPPSSSPQGSKPVEASQLSATQPHFFASSPHARPGLKASQPGSPRTFPEATAPSDPWAASQSKQKLQYGNNPSVGGTAADVLTSQQAAAQAAADAVRKRIEEARAKAAAQAASMWGIQSSVTAPVDLKTNDSVLSSSKEPVKQSTQGSLSKQPSAQVHSLAPSDAKPLSVSSRHASATAPGSKASSSKPGKLSDGPSQASSRPSSATSGLSKVASSRSSNVGDSAASTESPLDADAAPQQASEGSSAFSGRPSRSHSLSQRPSKAASSSQADGLSQRPSKAASSPQADGLSQRSSKAASSSQADGQSQRSSDAASSSQAEDKGGSLSSGKQSRSHSLSQRPSKAASSASKAASHQSSHSKDSSTAAPPPGLASAMGSGITASSELKSADLFGEDSGDSLGLDALRDMVLQGIEDESGAAPGGNKPKGNSSKGSGSLASATGAQEQPDEAASASGGTYAVEEPAVDADADQQLDVEAPSEAGQGSDAGQEVAEQEVDGKDENSSEQAEEEAPAEGEDEQDEEADEERSSWMSGGSTFSIGTMEHEFLVGGSFHISGDLATALSMRRAASRRSKKQMSMKDRVMSGNLEMVTEQEVEVAGQQEAAISKAEEQAQPDAQPDAGLDEEDSFADIYKAAEGLQGLVSNPSKALSSRVSSKAGKSISAAVERAPSPSEKASGSSWDELLHQARASAENEEGYEDVGDEGTEVDWDAVSVDSKMARSIAA